MNTKLIYQIALYSMTISYFALGLFSNTTRLKTIGILLTVVNFLIFYR